jgi:outer membrane immunogenic protein
MIMARTDVAVRVIGGGAALMAGSAGLAQAQDVGGWYGGIGVGANGGDYLAFGSDEYSFDGSPRASLFAGYNVVSGNLVYGGEISVNGKAESSDVGAIYAGHLTNVIDLKARVGTMVGSTLFYGSLGYSISDIEVAWDGETGGDASGVNFGVGFEAAVGDRMFIGGDITSRNMNVGGTLYGAPAEDYIDDINLSTVSIRMGFRF